MPISRRALIAGAAAIGPSAAAACVIDSEPLPDHEAVNAVVRRLAEIERAARQVRDILPYIPEIETAALAENADHMIRWQTGELTRTCAELLDSARGLSTIVAAFTADIDA